MKNLTKYMKNLKTYKYNTNSRLSRIFYKRKFLQSSNTSEDFNKSSLYSFKVDESLTKDEYFNRQNADQYQKQNFKNGIIKISQKLKYSQERISLAKLKQAIENYFENINISNVSTATISNKILRTDVDFGGKVLTKDISSNKKKDSVEHSGIIDIIKEYGNKIRQSKWKRKATTSNEEDNEKRRQIEDLKGSTIVLISGSRKTTEIDVLKNLSPYSNFSFPYKKHDGKLQESSHSIIDPLKECTSNEINDLSKSSHFTFDNYACRINSCPRKDSRQIPLGQTIFSGILTLNNSKVYIQNSLKNMEQYWDNYLKFGYGFNQLNYSTYDVPINNYSTLENLTLFVSASGNKYKDFYSNKKSEEDSNETEITSDNTNSESSSNEEKPLRATYVGDQDEENREQNQNEDSIKSKDFKIPNYVSISPPDNSSQGHSNITPSNEIKKASTIPVNKKYGYKTNVSNSVEPQKTMMQQGVTSDVDVSNLMSTSENTERSESSRCKRKEDKKNDSRSNDSRYGWQCPETTKRCPTSGNTGGSGSAYEFFSSNCFWLRNSGAINVVLGLLLGYLLYKALVSPEKKESTEKNNKKHDGTQKPKDGKTTEKDKKESEKLKQEEEKLKEAARREKEKLEKEAKKLEEEAKRLEEEAKKK